MKRATCWAALVGAILVGCGDDRSVAPAPPGPAPAAGPRAKAVVLTADEIEQVNKLPEAERAEALAQGVCPVSSEEDPEGGHLGAMGKPLKKVVDGQAVYLCCPGCEETFDKDPKKYLARAEQSRRSQ